MQDWQLNVIPDWSLRERVHLKKKQKIVGDAVFVGINLWRSLFFPLCYQFCFKKNVTGNMMEYDESLYNQIKRPKRKQNHYAYVLLIVNVTMQ